MPKPRRLRPIITTTNATTTAGAVRPSTPAGRPGAGRLVTLQSLEEFACSPDEAERRALTATHPVTLAIGTARLRVLFSRASAAAQFASRFAEAVTTGPPTLTLYAVADRDGASLWVTPDRTRRFDDSASDDLVVFLADNVLMDEYLRSSDAAGLHAAAVSSGGNLAALVGSSTAGKTTTAIACVANGAVLFSDERCIIENGRVVPFLRAISLREGGRRALLADATDQRVAAHLRNAPEHGDTVFPLRQLCGDRIGDGPQELRAVFILEGHQASPLIEPATLVSIMPALLRSFVCRQAGIDRAARLLGELRDVVCYRLRLGSPEATARAISATLDELPAYAGR